MTEVSSCGEDPDAASERLRAQAFDTLSELVRAWRQQGRKTFASGLKPGLQQQLDGFSEQQFGFSTFHAFVTAAEEAGRVRVQRLSSGQSMVLLPEEASFQESVPEVSRQVGAVAAPNTAVSRSARHATRRLRPEVWSTFVDWHDLHERLWDRQAARCFAYPVDEAGSAAWTSDPGRFAAVSAVSQSEQIRWMNEWSAALVDPARRRLLAALAPDAARGQFKRELAAVGLASEWRSELKRRVLDHVSAWAHEHNVSLEQLVDKRPDPDRRQPAQSAVSRDAAGSFRAMRSRGEDEASQLRDLVHRAVERMSLDELRALPVRAEHLLDL